MRRIKNNLIQYSIDLSRKWCTDTNTVRITHWKRLLIRCPIPILFHNALELHVHHDFWIVNSFVFFSKFLQNLHSIQVYFLFLHMLFLRQMLLFLYSIFIIHLPFPFHYFSSQTIFILSLKTCSPKKALCNFWLNS